MRELTRLINNVDRHQDETSFIIQDVIRFTKLSSEFYEGAIYTRRKIGDRIENY